MFSDDLSSMNSFASPALGNLGLGGKPFMHHSSLRYPSPFLDLASFYLPKSVKEQFHYCRYYYKTSPVINPIVRTLSRYPITEIIVREEDLGVKAFWDNYINYVLKLRPFCISVNLDYYTYGNAFVYIYYPIQKVLRCKNCRREERIEDAKYRFRSLKYEMSCKVCGVIYQEAEVKDYEKKSANDIRLIRLNPELIDIDTCPLTGRTDYFYTLPRYLRNEIVIGKRHIVESINDIYIDSLRKQRRLKLSDVKIFHFSRPSISEQETTGWGEPMITPVLKSSYYTQVLRKAQEAIMHSSIVPLRFVFPQPGDSQANASPYNAVNLLRWTNTLKTELVKWRRDPNHVGIVPLPVGHQVVGADGKALTLFNELEICFNEICNGMGVPLELYKGGLSWSGSNMSLRLMQNDFLNNRTDMYNFCENFVLKNIASFLGKNPPKIEFAKFKMADDLQRSALENQLFQQQLISGETVVTGMDYDFVEEKKRIKNEQQDMRIIQRDNMLFQARAQGQAQNVQMVLQAQGQKASMAAQAQPQAQAQQPQNPIPEEQGASPIQDEAPGMDVNAIASQYKTEVAKLNPLDKQNMMTALRMTSPDVYAQVVSMQDSEQGSKFDPLASALSEIKPPRSPGATA